MNDADLQKFRQAIDLAQLNRDDEAHKLLNELRHTDPGNSKVLLWSAFTATDLTEAKNTIREAAILDPLNPEIIRANTWLEEQQKRRLGKRYRGDITGTFVPLLPPELRNIPASTPSTFVAPTALVPAQVGVQGAVQAQATGPVVTVTPVQTTPATPTKPAKKATPKLPKIKPPKTVKYRTGPSFGAHLKTVLFLFTVTVILLAAIGAGLLLIQPVREFVFNTGPLTQTEQSFYNDATSINDQATTRLNTVYNCIINVNPRICTLEDGYKQAYVGLGEVSAKFQALKDPSNRFDGPYNTLLRAYSSLGTTSSFSFEAINQHTMVANQAETARRLDEGRKLLEQGKAELKSVAQQYGSKK